MAEHAAHRYATATGNDYGEHQRTYASVIRMTKVSIATIIAILIAMAIYSVAEIKWVGMLGLVLSFGAAVVGLNSRRGGVGPLVGVIVLMLLLWAIAR
jgi:hypothetical protein